VDQFFRSGRTAVIGLGLAVLSLAGGCGLTQNDTRQLPTEVVVWGDPDPENEEQFTSVRDANDVSDRWVLIGTDGQVEFSNGLVCRECTVSDATISLSGTPRMNIRFGTGPDGEGERRPFLVSTDGFYIELVTSGDSVTFQEEEAVFEENDDPSDDLAERVDTMANPTLGDQGGSSGFSLCGAGVIGFLPLMLLGLVLTPRTRRRRA
jgi:hypothetical protein